MQTQLTLGVGLKDDATFANFYAAENQQLITELKKIAMGAGERFIYFCGGSGEGCTHLLQAVCHEANQHHLRSVYIPLENIRDFSPEMLDDLEMLDVICIDDIHKIAGLPAWEEAFFHAYNRIHDANKKLIVTANALPNDLQFTLPDLQSRLNWGVIFQLQSLSDTEKLHVLVMRAERRGMSLSEEVGKYILNHCPRHMTTLFAALDTLDKISLAAQRKLTIPFVKTVLQI